jgi:hypothetical protein
VIGPLNCIDQEDVKMRTAITGLGFALTFALVAQANAAEIDWANVDKALGKTASVQGDVHRFGIPRSDLQVTLDGVVIKPAFCTCSYDEPYAPTPDLSPVKSGTLAVGGEGKSYSYPPPCSRSQERPWRCTGNPQCFFRVPHERRNATLASR